MSVMDVHYVVPVIGQKEIIMTPRKWTIGSTKVVEANRTTGKDHALIAACPGAGKTLFAVKLARDWLRDGIVQLIVIVVPSKAIKRQWKKTFKRVGIKSLDDIDNSTLDENYKRGMELYDPAKPVHIVTYAQVAANSELFAVQCARYKVLVVMDEIHHAADEAIYGKRLREGFSDAVFKLSLTGTPFNTEGTSLAFCEFEKAVNGDGKEVNRTVLDFSYSYGEALSAKGTDDDPNVVRVLEFPRWNGYAIWKLEDDEGNKIERTFDGSRQTDPLSPLLDPELDSLKKMLRKALDTLEERRKKHKNAGMLIVGRDGAHCDAIAEILRSMGVIDITLVLYDIPGAHKEIERFEKSSDRILIAVKMISEGVDIKRLRVGVYASNVLTRMFFIQFCGRFMRWDESLDATQYGTVFIPEHVVLVKYAKEIERMIDESIIPEGGDGPGWQPPRWELVDKEGDGQMDGSIGRGISVEESNRLWCEGVRKKSELDFTDVVLLRLRAAMQGEEYNPEFSAEDESNLSKDNDKLVSQIVLIGKRIGREDLTYARVQVVANQHVGIQCKNRLTPDDVLQRRKEFLKRWYLSLRKTGRDYDGNE